MNRLIGITVLATALAQAGAATDPPDRDRLAWFREAKFGMFIHWGPYSALRGEWNGNRIPQGKQAEWIMNLLRIPAVEYRELAHQFNPVHFDAPAWARLAKQAGMKYLVITAKHHDGFAMYHSKVSPYNIVDWTPFRRDVLEELAEACRQEGIRFCIYYSHREDWDDPDAYGNTWDFDPARANFERYLERKSKPQLRELLTNYGPVGLVWFDRGMYTPAQAAEFRELVRSLQPRCLINGRIGNYDQALMGDYQSMGDNGMPPGGLDEYWETPQTLNGSWGYHRFDHDWKTPGQVIRGMVDAISKGGNYLLNIGPDGDGKLPGPTASILEEVGKWVARNADSIYGATGSPFSVLPWGACTVKGKRLYLHVWKWPESGYLRVPGLKTPVVSARLLAAPGRALVVTRERSGVSVKAPSGPTDPIDTVVVMDLAGAPEVDIDVVAPGKDGSLHLDYMQAVTRGRAAKRFTRGGGYHIASWMAPEDSASWQVEVPAAGRFKLRICYAAGNDWQDGAWEARIGRQTIRGAVKNTGEWYKYGCFEAGDIRLAPGIHTVQLRPAATLKHELVYFQSMDLVPAARADPPALNPHVMRSPRAQETP